MRKIVYPKRITANRRITSADEPSKLQDTIAQLKDDFDYLLEGLDYLDRSGAEASNNGLIIAEGLLENLHNVIDSISQEV